MLDTQNIEKMLIEYNVPEDFEGKEEIWNAVKLDAPHEKRKTNPKVFKVAILAAVLMVVVTTGVFAEEIAQAVHSWVYGDITIEQYGAEDLPKELEGNTRGRLGIFVGENLPRLEQDVLEMISGSKTAVLKNMEEAKEAVDFELNIPTLPSGYKFVKAETLQLTNGEYLGQGITLCYEDSLMYEVRVAQFYVGAGTKLEYKTQDIVYGMKGIEIVGNEALIYENGVEWIDDGIHYSVYADGVNEEVKREAAIKFAEALYGEE